MKVSLDYGRGSIEVDLPDDCDVTEIVKRPTEPIKSPREAVYAALESPHGAQSLATLAHGRASACILICDITRPVPNGLILRPMIETMVKAGVPKAAITVLVATGLHRPNEGSELDTLIDDPWVLENVRVENHFARDDAAHVDLGVTPLRKVPVKLDRRFVDADLRVVTGLVEPHFMAGYSGGRKVIAPGIAHEQTIRTFHNAKFMGDPAARECNLVGNPLHEEQLAIVEMVGEVYALNTVLDEKRNLTFINFGHIEQSHLAAIDFVKASSLVPVERQFSTVLTSSAGYPLDQTYYQTVKGMVTPRGIFADNARLLIAADCSEGLGSPEYREAQQRLVSMGPGAFAEAIERQPLAAIDEWQTQMQLKPMAVAEVGLYSHGLPEADWPFTGVNRIDDLSRAVSSALDASGDRAIAVIPEGPYVVPYYETRA